MKKIGIGAALLAAVLLCIGCTNPIHKLDLGASYLGTGATIGIEFKGTDNDILVIAQANAATLAKTGAIKLPKGIEDRAVVFGNNYPGTEAELRQCVADAARNTVNLVRVDHFNPGSIALFINEACTKSNIEKAAIWALGDGSTGRRAFMNSSHGAQDTNTDGKIINIIVTADMVKSGVWDATTEVSPDFWHTLLRKSKAPWIVLNDSCHSGGQMRAAVGIGARYPAVRAYSGPSAVQTRLRAAVGSHSPDLDAIKTGTVFAACRADQLANETAAGGAATVAYWDSRKALGADLSIRNIIRTANGKLREGGNTQNMNPVGSVNLIWKP